MFSIVGSIAWFVITVMTLIGLPGLFLLMVVESFGIPPLPSELILPFAGFLVASGTFPLGWTVASILSGALVGSFIAYAVGRWGRGSLLRWTEGGRLRLDPALLDRVDGWFRHRGEATVALLRMVPVVRSYISYPAGFARMPWPKFGLFTLLGTLPFALGFLYLGFVLESRWTIVESYFSTADLVLVGSVVAAAVYLLLVATDRITWGWPPRRIRRSELAPTIGSPPPV